MIACYEEMERSRRVGLVRQNGKERMFIQWETGVAVKRTSHSKDRCE
jgi:hypothetical protein